MRLWCFGVRGCSVGKDFSIGDIRAWDPESCVSSRGYARASHGYAAWAAVTPKPIIRFFVERDKTLLKKMETMIEKENRRKLGARWGRVFEESKGERKQGRESQGDAGAR